MSAKGHRLTGTTMIMRLLSRITDKCSAKVIYIFVGFIISATIGDTGSAEHAPIRYANRQGPGPGPTSLFDVFQRSIETTTECVTFPPQRGGAQSNGASPQGGAQPNGASPQGGAQSNGASPQGGAQSNGASPGGAPSASPPVPAPSPTSTDSGSGSGSGSSGSGGAPFGGLYNFNVDTSGVPMDERISQSTSKLHALIQHIYAAQARVQLEATEIKKAQGVATTAQKALEEAANNVRVITSALHTAQQEVAAAAVRAQSAQLQLAAHDQLLFAARQKVDALSAQMVGLQAQDGVIAPKPIVNLQKLLSQLKDPLPQTATPTPIPPVDLPDKNLGISASNELKPSPSPSPSPSQDPKGGFLETYDEYAYLET